MRPRGVTLIELLLAIAIVVGMLALVFPVMSGRLSERAFDSALDQVESHLLLARAEAMQSRQAVEVIYLHELRRLEARRFETSSAGANFLDSAGAFTARVDDDDPQQQSLALSWARLRLPEDVRFSARRPSMADLEGMARESSERRGPGEREVMRIAIFLGDGSSMLDRAWWLHDLSRRAARLRINPWTGVPRFERADLMRNSEDHERAIEDEDAEFEFSAPAAVRSGGGAR